MKLLINIYKNKIIIWYVVSFIFFISLIFVFSQILKLMNNYQKFISLIENKKTLMPQIENLSIWVSKTNLNSLKEPQTIPINVSFEINSLSKALFNLSPLYSENGSLFRIKEFTISPCEKTEKETFNNRCFYTIKLIGEKVKYMF